MPKVIVLFFGAERAAVTLAEAAAEGATGVRFTEVEVRSGAQHQPTTTQRHKRLESSSRLRDFDGIVLVSPSVGGVPSELTMMLDELERSSMAGFANTVFGITGGEDTALAGHVMRLGGIVVAALARTADPEVRARRLGARVATLAGWVRHALDHEHEHHEHHEHRHERH
jgi:NADPH-dependent FMN reductase